MKDSYFSWKQQCKKNTQWWFIFFIFLQTRIFLFFFTTDKLKDWSGVDYCGVLLAVWTLIMTAPIHCRGSIGEQDM